MTSLRRRQWARSLGLVTAVSLVLCAVATASPGAADQRPAFSLYSSHVWTTKERPTVELMFRQVTSLDFRVYRVEDPLKFFAQLRDPHTLGSEAPVVPQERTWLERLADWKAQQRYTIRHFVRGQFSSNYRQARKETAAKRQIVLRQPLDYRQFAQVPLLNRSQLVTSWREVLPPVRDAEFRKIPLELPGEGVYVVESVNAPLKAYTVVVVSDLGLVTKTAPGQMLMFAANRFTGEPASGCPAEIIANQKVAASGTLSADGVFEAAMPVNRMDNVVAVVGCGKQVAATDPGSWFTGEKTRDLTGYVYTDKPVYRPGHTVNIKGVLRWQVGDGIVPFDGKQVEVSVSDPNDKVVLRQKATVDEFGSVLATLPLAKGVALGYYAISIVSGEFEAQGDFEVQEYRKPEFEVAVKPAAKFVIQGGQAVAKVNARYYFGQPVAGGIVHYVVHKQPYSSPLRWSDPDEAEDAPSGWYGGEESVQGTARLDGSGIAEISVPLDRDEARHDFSARIEARVTDASSREVAGSTVVHATVGRFMVIARTDRYAYEPASQATLKLAALDYTGVVQPNVHTTVALERVTYDSGHYDKPKVTRVAEASVTTGDDGRAEWTVTLPAESGSYRFSAEADADGHKVTDSDSLWVSGHVSEEGGYEPDQELELIPDKKSYQPGDVVRLTIKGVAASAAMLVTKEARRVDWSAVMRQAPSVVEVPIGDGDIGDIYVNLAFLKGDRLYRAEKRLKVPAVSKQLTVTVTADREVAKPREPAMLTVKVQDQAGRPVRAQVSLGVIDEAVYGVKPDSTPDPLRFFYRREYSRVTTEFSRDYTFVGYSGTQQLLLAQRHRPMALADFKSDRPSQQVRKDFPDAIYWNGGLVTGADGTARVQITYPDTLTAWRVTARAVTTDTLVGWTTARTTVTKDLIVRVVTPRFLPEGDEVTVPAIVHNYLAAAKSATVALRADGVSLPKGQAEPRPQVVDTTQSGEARTDWRFVADRVGTAVFTGSAAAGAERDAVEVSIPVLPFGLKRSLGAAGSVVGQGDAKAELVVPQSANPAARAIRVSMAPSLAGPLLGALDFLTSYPYGCTEQTLSSFLPNLMVLRALDQLKIAPTERMQALDRQVSEGLARLYDYQHEDGGWGWWKTDENEPFMTAYAVYGLLEAERAGYRVDQWRMTRGAEALMRLYVRYPRAVPDLKAYMAYVLADLQTTSHLPSSVTRPPNGSVAVEEAWARRDGMSAYGQALVLLALDALKDRRGDQLAKTLVGSVQRKGDLAWWSVPNDPLLEDSGDTSVEATAFVVKALAARDPKSPLLEPAVRWLLLNRNYGTWWSSTKQTAMVLYGLLDYMRARNEGGADSTVEVLVNGAPVATRTFTPASLTEPDPVVVTAPAIAGTNTVVLHKKGGGSLYWSALAEYYDTTGVSERTGSRKLAIVRKYYSLTPVRVQERIVYRETPFSGTAQPGDLLLVRVDAAGSSDWRYLMIEDPLPAGVEAIQQRDLYDLERRAPFWDGSRREYHDDRVVFFQESFGAGHYEFVYLLKVTTPGVFKAMPAQISAMYVADATASSEPQTLIVAAPRPGGPDK